MVHLIRPSTSSWFHPKCRGGIGGGQPEEHSRHTLLVNCDTVEVLAPMDQFSSSHDPDAEKRILGSWHRSVHDACLDCETWGGVLAIESSHITTWVVCLQPLPYDIYARLRAL